MSEYYRPQQTSTTAIISLIASIAGLTVLPTIGSIAGVILGYMAKKEIEGSGGAIGGDGLAKGGIIIGWIGIVLAAIGICVFLAFFLGTGGLTACAILGNSY